MTAPDRIWLEPRVEAEDSDNPSWCESRSLGVAAGWAEFVRADISAAAVAQARQDALEEAWQPIETYKHIPGENALIDCPQWGVVEAYYEAQATPPFWNVDVHDFCDLSRYGRLHVEAFPTHWRPMPAAIRALKDKEPT